MENQVEVRKTTEMQLMPQSDMELEQRIKGAERYLELQDQMRKLAIKVTNHNDWIDQNGNPYLEISGANKIASAFGASCSDVVFEKETLKDDKGEYVVYSCMANFSWNKRTMSATGTGSTRDSFFGKANNQWKPLSEVDLTNIKKKANTNMLNRGIKGLLGLSYTWEEVEKFSDGRITRSTVTGVKYQKGSKGGNEDSQEDKEMRQVMGKMLMVIGGDNVENASTALETLTKWTNKKGEEVSGKKSVRDITTNALKIANSKVKSAYINYCDENNLPKDLIKEK
jgi:hypothetical protein